MAYLFCVFCFAPVSPPKLFCILRGAQASLAVRSIRYCCFESPPLHLDHLDSNPTCISPASDVTSGPLHGFCTPSFLHPENRDNHHAPHRIIAEIKRQCRQCVEPSKCSTNICYYDYYAKCPINTCSMNKQVKPEDTGAHRLLQGNRKGICSPG